MFDIDEFARIWGSGIPKPYLEKIKAASNTELKAFRREVKKHKKKPQKVNYAREVTPQGIKKFSIHDDILLKAIWWESNRRSKIKMWFYKLTVPLRKWWASFWLGSDFIESDYFGYALKGRERGQTKLEFCGFRKCFLDFMEDCKNYFIKHHRWIIGSIIALLGIYVGWINSK